MVSVYTRHYLYDEDNCHSVEAGDSLESITYINDNGEEVTLKDIQISSIGVKAIMLEDSDYTEYMIYIEDIVSFEY